MKKFPIPINIIQTSTGKGKIKELVFRVSACQWKTPGKTDDTRERALV